MFIRSIILGLLIFACIISPVAHSVEVIANVNANVTVLTKSQLRRIYSMRQTRWPNDLPIVVFVLPSSHQLHQNFSKKKLGLLSYKLDGIWNKLTYSGVGTGPIIVDSPEALIEAVIHTSGAIGYAQDLSVVKDAYVITIEG